jgi:hypothetical protein
MEAGQLNAQLAPVAGFWQTAVLYVVFEVEMFVIDPIREIKFEGHAFETTPEQWTHVQAALDMGKNVLESHDLATRPPGTVDGSKIATAVTWM